MEQNAEMDRYVLCCESSAGMAYGAGEKKIPESRILDVDERQRDEALRRNRMARERERQGIRRKKRKRARRRRIRRLLVRVVLLYFFLVAGSAGLKFIQSVVKGNSGYDTLTLSREELKQTDAWKRISENRSRYPEGMLEVLENNPELLEFVEYYPDAEPVVTGGLIKEEVEEAYPLFLQWDSRWGYVPYGDDNIGLSGCAPTCLSMVIFGLTRNVEATPDAIAAFSQENGYYVKGTGTSWELMTAAAAWYGVTAEELSLDEGLMKRCLDDGRLIICSMGPGDFTTTGHFIVLYDYNEEGFFINDPFSRKRSQRTWNFETIRYQIRNMWVYG